MPLEMPIIKLEEAELTPEQYEIAKGILLSRGDGKGRLRASRPTAAPGETQYVWRMVAYQVSPRQEHQCMPVMAYIYLPGETAEENREMADGLDEIVDKITDVVPLHELHGVLRWARAGAI